MRRRSSREGAMQILYSLERSLGDSPDLEQVIDLCLRQFLRANDLDEDFLRSLVRGAWEERNEVADLISGQSENWRLERMALVDRCILRVAAYELRHRDDISASVTLNEAVEIAKRFGTEESGAFINGILDQIRKQLPGNPNKVSF